MFSILKSLRHELHRHPELSGEESATAQRIKAFAAKHRPTQIISGIGGHGLAIVYQFSSQGPCIMIRCELDALPIEEANAFEHRSAVKGISHKCGHDGHMAIVAGLALDRRTNYQQRKNRLAFSACRRNRQRRCSSHG